MKILAVPFPSLKAVSEKINDFFTTLKYELISIFSRSQTDRPSRMYRLIFSTQKLRKPIPVKEQYIVQEPDYYGNYE
jgi:hypothetical protein